MATARELQRRPQQEIVPQLLLVATPAARRRGSLKLAVGVSVGGRGDTAILYRLAIPPGALKGGLMAMFGDRERTLEDLYRHHGRARIVIHPLSILESDPRGGFTYASRVQFQQRVLGTAPACRGLRAHRVCVFASILSAC